MCLYIFYVCLFCRCFFYGCLTETSHILLIFIRCQHGSYMYVYKILKCNALKYYIPATDGSSWWQLSFSVCVFAAKWQYIHKKKRQTNKNCDKKSMLIVLDGASRGDSFKMMHNTIQQIYTFCREENCTRLRDSAYESHWEREKTMLNIPFLFSLQNNLYKLCVFAHATNEEPENYGQQHTERQQNNDKSVFK